MDEDLHGETGSGAAGPFLAWEGRSKWCARGDPFARHALRGGRSGAPGATTLSAAPSGRIRAPASGRNSLVGEDAEVGGMAEELRLSREHDRLLAEHMSDVIWTLDLEGRFTYVSPSVERLRGYRPEEIVGLPLEGALLPEEACEFRQRLPGAIELLRHSRGAQFRGRVTQPCRDGRTIPSEVVINGVYDAEGRLVALLGVTREISEQVRMEEELRRAKEMAEQALAEVRTLSGLIPICAGCKSIRDDQGFWKQVEEYLSARTGADFSHGMCPACAREYFPECCVDAPIQEGTPPLPR